MNHLFCFAILGRSIVPYTYLLNAAFFFSLIVVGMLLFIAYYLYRHSKRLKKKEQLSVLFGDLIAETILCETEDERRTMLHQFLAQNTALMGKAFPRIALIKEIVRTMNSINGGAAENLRWLYETMDLDRDTLRRFSSGKWHRKASAIQQLAEMRQSKHLVKIYRETNNSNSHIRTEAQLAVVKLTGFKGLRFLSIVSHPVSQWQQLSLISQLQEGEIEEENIRQWLCSKNETVVQFALRLCQVYKCHTLHDAVVECLTHSSSSVRVLALQALKEIDNDSTPAALLRHFPNANKEEQLVMLDLLKEMNAGKHELRFFTTLLQHHDEAIRYRAMQLIRQISPAWSSVVLRHINSSPFLSPIEKEAV